MNATTPDPELLADVRGRQWFYEFDLPDGSRTSSYLPPGVEKRELHAFLLQIAGDHPVDRRKETS